MGLKKTPIIGLGGCIGFECKPKGVRLVKCLNSEAGEIITKNHYSGRASGRPLYSFLVYWHGAVHGAIQIGVGIKPNVKGGFPFQTTREFDRMWLSDDMPKYSETIVISLIIHYIRQETKVTHLISWADGSAGNVGTIYKASNFTFVKKIPVDFYEVGGKRVHPITMYMRHKTRAWAALQSLYPGIKRLDGFQYQYVYEIKR